MAAKTSSLWLCCFSIILLGLSPYYPVVQFERNAQNDSWSEPQTIPGYDKGAWPPYLIADQNRQVHAFSSQWIKQRNGESYSAIVYNRWTVSGDWTQPIDILLSPSGEARLEDAFLDSGGFVHLVFWAGDADSANFYYSRSDLATVDQVMSWSTPIVVAENVGDPPSAVLTENKAGDLVLIYHGRQFGNGVYVIKSKDGGATWSTPRLIFQSDTIAPLVWNLQKTGDNTEWLHVVWNVITIGGQGRGIYYSRSQDGDEWTEPALLDYAKEGYGTQTPAIVEYKGDLIALFAGIYMRESSDNGETWSDAGKIFFRHVGVNGSLSPVIDGNGGLHLFFGQRITGNPDIHGMWHSTFVNNRWTEPEAIVKGPAVNDVLGDNSFDPYEARAVVSQGNVLLVVWRTDPGLRGNGVWYSYKVLDIPETLSPQATIVGQLEPPAVADIEGNTESSGFAPTPMPAASNPQSFNKSQSTVFNYGYLIFLGVLPAVIIIFLLVVARIRHMSRL